MNKFLFSLSVVFLLIGSIFGKEAKIKNSQWWWPLRDTPTDPVVPTGADPLGVTPTNLGSTIDPLSSPYGLSGGFGGGFARSFRRTLGF